MNKHTTAVAIELIKAFSKKKRSKPSKDLYLELPNLVGMKLYFPPSEIILRAIKLNHIKDLTPDLDYEVIGIDADCWPIIGDDIGDSLSVPLHVVTAHLHHLEYFRIRKSGEHA